MAEAPIDNDDESLGLLPKSMAPVVEAIGMSAAISLVHVYAGTRLYVPAPDNLHTEHPLCKLLGEPLAAMLAKAIGGDYLLVPVARTLRDSDRQRVIVARATAGESYADIARSLGMTERAVQATLDRSRRTA